MTLLVNPDTVELAQLENPLQEPAKRHQILIRLKINCQAWLEHFSIVLVCARHATLLPYVLTLAVTYIAAPGEVMAFEIDRPHKVFLQFQRYCVNPVCERLKGEKDGLLHA